MPLPALPALPALRQLLGRRGEDDVATAVHPESTLESMFAYQAERELVVDLPELPRRGTHRNP